MLPLGGALALALKKERGARLTGMAVALRQADPAPFDPPSLSISPPSAHLSLSLSPHRPSQKCLCGEILAWEFTITFSCL